MSNPSSSERAGYDAANRAAIVLREVTPTDPAARHLMERLTLELSARYGDDGGGHYSPEDAEHEGAAFVIASLDGTTVGCGAVRPLDSTGVVGEVKRMYVEPAARGSGVARAVLSGLEEMATARGYRALRLETGIMQPEAIRLYERAGYLPIPCYGYYAEDPRSRCYEKRLSG